MREGRPQKLHIVLSESNEKRQPLRRPNGGTPAANGGQAQKEEEEEEVQIVAEICGKSKKNEDQVQILMEKERGKENRECKIESSVDETGTQMFIV